MGRRHVETEGNDRAVELANQATELEPRTPLSTAIQRCAKREDHFSEVEAFGKRPVVRPCPHCKDSGSRGLY